MHGRRCALLGTIRGIGVLGHLDLTVNLLEMPRKALAQSPYSVTLLSHGPHAIIECRQ